MKILSKIFLKNRFDEQKKEITKVFEKIHSPRKSPDSPGGFEFKGARKINSRVISEVG